MKMNKSPKVSLIFYDFDGVMTDNKVYIDQNGQETVQVNRSDGLGVDGIKKLGISQIIVSTEKNPVVQARAKKLGIKCFYNIRNKLECITDYTKKKNIHFKNVCFVGNDINDLEAMKVVGMKVCPRDAHKDVNLISDIVLKSKGGGGVIRELFDLLKLHKEEI